MRGAIAAAFRTDFILKGVNMERTFVLIKPDGVQRALIGKIICKFEDAGLKLVAIKMIKASKETAGSHYADDKAWLESVGKKSIASYEAKGVKTNETALEIGNRVRNYLMDYITGGPAVAMVIEGNDAVSIVPKLVGSTAPARADPSTIRGAYASDSYDMADAKKRPVRNLIHASDSLDSANREIAIWFKPAEIAEYRRADEAVMFD
ncbi:Nucleoside diphosphate kinase [uncultured archaeon]|nr:Nucleoside diphosphate kinase [uncultured archaeon]